jgi:predicted  nucleic acid-binding Zn-ribbon protein
MMIETLEMLTKLQEIDQRVDQLAHSRVDLPEKIESLKVQVRELEDLIAEDQARLEQLEKDKRQEELGLQEARDELKRYQEQLYRIKTNREYDAIQAEIDAQKEKISQHEENILNIMATSEEVTEGLEAHTRELEQTRSENAPQWEQLEQDLSSLDDRIAAENDQRKNVSIRIDDNILKAYERIRKGKNGLAIVAIRKRACGGCFKTLPPQKIQEIRRTDRIITCENCGRILYWDADSQN